VNGYDSVLRARADLHNLARNMQKESLSELLQPVDHPSDMATGEKVCSA
jgi:hypothetical protein